MGMGKKGKRLPSYDNARVPKSCSLWTQGQPYVDEVVKYAYATSVLRVYARQVFFIIESFRTSIVLAIVVHPTFLLFWPTIKITNIFAVLKSLKKRSVGNLNKKMFKQH